MTERRAPVAEANATSATSLTLLDRARAADPDAWQRLVSLYSPLVFAWLRRAGLGEADAADQLQEVWQSVSGALDRFERDADRGSFRGWLWTVTRNKVRDFFRAQRGNPAAAGGTDACQMLQHVPEHEPTDESGVEDHRLLHSAVQLIRGEFEERTWRAFWEMAVAGRSAAEVGREVGLAANAVHQAKFRVLRRLRQEMSGLLNDVLPSSGS